MLILDEGNVMEQQSQNVQAVAFTVKNLAITLQISESMVWKLISDGRLKSIKIGRRTLVPSIEVTRLLNGGAS